MTDVGPFPRCSSDHDVGGEADICVKPDYFPDLSPEEGVTSFPQVLVPEGPSTQCLVTWVLGNNCSTGFGLIIGYLDP